MPWCFRMFFHTSISLATPGRPPLSNILNSRTHISSLLGISHFLRVSPCCFGCLRIRVICRFGCVVFFYCFVCAGRDSVACCRKTISVSMFAAAMIFAAPCVEVSIYSTCKRISQKLLRNVLSFLDIIHAGLGVPKYKVIRCNMEELVVKGPESSQDRRVINSYPSKVFPVPF